MHALHKKILKNSIFLVLILLIPVSLQAQKKRDNSIEVACLEAIELKSVEASKEWCKCQNAYYADLLTDEDWELYTRDYYALVYLQNSNKDTKANSYERFLELGGSTCGGCVRSNYKDRECVKYSSDSISANKQDDIITNIQDGQFDKVQKDKHYDAFFVNFIGGYSSFCGHKLNDYVERTTTVTTWTGNAHSWYESDTQTGTIRVDRSLWPAYKQRENSAEMQLASDMFGSVMDDLREQRIPTGMIEEVMRSTVSPIMFMQKRIAGKCDTPEVQRIYDNVFRFELGQSAIRAANADNKEQQEVSALQQHYQEIRKLTRESYQRYLKTLDQEQAKRAALPSGKLSCMENNDYTADLERAGKNATHIPRLSGTGGLPGLQGTWKAKIGEQPLELVTWNVGREHVAAYGYLPNYQCVLQVYVNNDGGYQHKSHAHMELKAFQGRAHPNNCESLTIGEDKNREMREFNMRGFLNWNDRSRAFKWFPYGEIRLGHATPETCDSFDEIRFTAAPLSAEFKQSLIRHQTQFPQAGIPLDVVNTR